MNFLSLFKLFKSISLWKTFRFNFHYFSFRTACRLPVFIYKRTVLQTLKGAIIIDAPLKTGLFKFGPCVSGIIDSQYCRTIWESNGTLIVKGKAVIGRGCRLSIGLDSVLSLGTNFFITGRTEIICHKGVSFGNNCLLSWDIHIMDTDHHPIFDENKKIINASSPILIGDNVWIGSQSTILKGVSIAANNVIAAGSLITSKLTNSSCVFGGRGRNVDIIRSGITWQR